ncbi:hypothetical protein A0128_06130 [Leptospira tipperaryensis]|uniref:Uncharacterized protein n=1 Tax=Leptospira tipperaryensis TaxID=2564040 RepID=A0A1D7UV30_9LEPT|nr:hypothetical protein [Leptospira tipperaryensis]AOP33460.1 hypothetical protein A0128_06130 [Leptospira tipperaryensis]
MYQAQLKLLKRISLSSANRFVIYKSHAFVCELYGSAREIHILDLTEPSDPKHVRSIRFKNAIGSLAIQENKLYATESRRALHEFDLTEISNPKFLESFILLGYDLYDLQISSDQAILAMNWEGVGIVDLKKPDSIQPLQRQKIDEGYVEKLVPFGDHFLLSNNSEFLYTFSTLEGRLKEVEKRSFPDFKPSKIFLNGEEIVLYGETKKGKKEFSSLLLLDKDLQAIGDPISIRHRPVNCLPLSDGNILCCFDYSYAYVDRKEKKILPLFELFEKRESKEYVEIPSKVLKRSSESDDGGEEEEYDSRRNELYCFDSLKSVSKKGNFLFATHGSDFLSFSISEDSMFQKILE